MKSIPLAALMVVLLFLSLEHPVIAQSISSQNVLAIAVYPRTPAAPDVLTPQQIIFNVTNPLLIDSLLEAIDFTTPRDGSDLLSLPNALVYIKFQDGSVGLFEVFDLWRHLCRRGFPGRCYSISAQGQRLLELYAQ